MKHHRIIWLVILLVAAILTGCGSVEPSITQTVPPTSTGTFTETAPEDTEATTTENTEETLPAETLPEESTGDIGYEGDAASHYIDVVYAEQIDRYYTALSEKWNESKYWDNDLSSLPYHYYEGDPLSNVGFGFVDLDNDGHLELIIGAILNAEQNPAVFEIWTLADGEPVMLAQSNAKNLYYLQYAEEENTWYVAYEAVSSAASHASYYLILTEGKFEVTQGILFDALADEENPWFMTYDLDWDVSNDDPIDEDMADAIMESNRTFYTHVEYFPYNLYK